MSQLGWVIQSCGLYPKGLPLENTPHDCPDTSLQYHSRHWITSFQMVADKLSVTQILCSSTVFTQPVLSTLPQ